MNITSDDVAYAIRRPRLNRLLELLWRRRRNRSAASERKIDPPETGLFFDSEMYDERFRESEILFMSMMWMGM